LDDVSGLSGGKRKKQMQKYYYLARGERVEVASNEQNRKSLSFFIRFDDYSDDDDVLAGGRC
jgi:hypothetical protein